VRRQKDCAVVAGLHSRMFADFRMTAQCAVIAPAVKHSSVPPGRNLGFPLATTSARCAPAGRQTKIPNYDKGALIHRSAMCACATFAYKHRSGTICLAARLLLCEQRQAQHLKKVFRDIVNISLDDKIK